MSGQTPNFIHAADLHLGTPLESLGARLGHAPDKLGALRQMASRSFDHLVQSALEREASFVVMAGDVYDRAEREVSAQLSFERGLRRLNDDGSSPIPVFVVHGNHDPLVSGFRSAVGLPGNVHVFESGEPGVHIVEIDGVGPVQVAGVSFSSATESENLVRRVGQAVGDGSRLSVGVVHANVEGTTGHDPYAPCLRSDLIDSPVGYWALGHVHKRTIEPMGTGRWWAYSGNLQGRSTKPSECGAKGVLSVPIDATGFGEPQFIECGALRFNRVEVDVSGASDVAEMITMVADMARQEADNAGERPVLLAVDLVGRTDFHVQLRKLGSDGLLDQCREETNGSLGLGELLRVRPRTRPDIDELAIRSGHGLLAELMKFIDGLDEKPDAEVAEWVNSHLEGALDQKVGEAVGLGDADGDFTHRDDGSEPSTQRRLLAACRDLLIDELAPIGDES